MKYLKYFENKTSMMRELLLDVADDLENIGLYVEFIDNIQEYKMTIKKLKPGIYTTDKWKDADGLNDIYPKIFLILNDKLKYLEDYEEMPVKFVRYWYTNGGENRYVSGGLYPEIPIPSNRELQMLTIAFKL